MGVSLASVAAFRRVAVLDVPERLLFRPVMQGSDGAGGGRLEAGGHLQVPALFHPARIVFADGGIEGLVVQELVAASPIGNLSGRGLELEGEGGGFEQLLFDARLCRSVIAAIEGEHVLETGDQVVDHRLPRIHVHAVDVEETQLVLEILVRVGPVSADAGHDTGTFAGGTEDAPVPGGLVADRGPAAVDVIRLHAGQGAAPRIRLLLREDSGLFHGQDAATDLLDGEVVAYLSEMRIPLPGARQLPGADVHHVDEGVQVLRHPAMGDQDAEIRREAGIAVLLDAVGVNLLIIGADVFRGVGLDGVLHQVEIDLFAFAPGSEGKEDGGHEDRRDKAVESHCSAIRRRTMASISGSWASMLVRSLYWARVRTRLCSGYLIL